MRKCNIYLGKLCAQMNVSAQMCCHRFNVALLMSLRMRKPTICIGEYKDAHQLCSNCTADQRLCFCHTDSTIPLLHLSKAKLLVFSCTSSSFYVWVSPKMSTWLTLLLPFFFFILGREVFLVLFIHIFINFASLRKLVHANEIFVAATLKTKR